MIKCLHPITLRRPGRVPERFEVPCGKCSLCLSRKRSDWSFRLMCETELADSAYFITLTYNDENCPCICNKKHIQDFLKRFRKRINSAPVRYFCVCDYGGKFGRPHYHLLLFNYPLCRERLISDLKASWKFCDEFMFNYGDAVAFVEPASINYVCKYCLGNLDSDDSDVRYWLLSSRNPAIGKNYLSDNMLRYVRRRFDGCTVFKGKKVPLPRYVMDKVFTAEEKELIQIKRFYDTENQNPDPVLFDQKLRDKDRIIRSKLKNK